MGASLKTCLARGCLNKRPEDSFVCRPCWDGLPNELKAKAVHFGMAKPDNWRKDIATMMVDHFWDYEKNKERN